MAPPWQLSVHLGSLAIPSVLHSLQPQLLPDRLHSAPQKITSQGRPHCSQQAQQHPLEPLKTVEPHHLIARPILPAPQQRLPHRAKIWEGLQQPSLGG